MSSKYINKVHFNWIKFEVFAVCVMLARGLFHFSSSMDQDNPVQSEQIERHWCHSSGVEDTEDLRSLRLWVSLGESRWWRIHFLYRMLSEFFELPSFLAKNASLQIHVIQSSEKITYV